MILAALAVGTPAVGVAKPASHPHPAAPAASRDWTSVVTMTPEGGFMMGNPAAKVKLVEFASYTCPHCARFWGEALPALRGRYVSTGAVSFEVRSFMRDRIDLAAALLARCGGPAHFFARSEALFTNQPQWLSAALNADSMQGPQLTATPPSDVLAAIAVGGGLDELLRPQGLPPTRINACVADQAAQARLVGIVVDAQRRGINSTPGFLINGSLQPVYTWATLEPRIRAALGG